MSPLIPEKQSKCKCDMLEPASIESGAILPRGFSDQQSAIGI
jgi:hypothetical protein